MKHIGWFSTGRGPGSRGLFQTVGDNIDAKIINGKIEFVFCSQEPGESENGDIFLDLVKSRDIPLVSLSSRKFNASYLLNDSISKEKALEERRLAYDREVMKLLTYYNPDFCMLAGYMLIVGDEMCQKYDMINLHPALPGGPTGTWQEVIWQLIETRATKSGIMMHLATPDLDRGPVVTYCSYPIIGEPFDRLWQQIAGLSSAQIISQEGENHPLFKLIRQYGYARELPLIVLTLKALCANKIKIISRQIFNQSGSIINGYDLSSEVNSLLTIK